MTGIKVVMDDRSIKELGVERETILDILGLLGVNPEEVIVAVNGKIVSEYDSIGKGDELKIVRIVHGG